MEQTKKCLPRSFFPLTKPLKSEVASQEVLEKCVKLVSACVYHSCATSGNVSVNVYMLLPLSLCAVLTPAHLIDST